ncbi:hypothetical protein SDC9_176766 [bioreactor metagenome]|uniref:Uncharacterized protein n=1 Tax=bioreactor metagenome TaxID=1076179 RepID=A0A645GZ36_9ZZZZ
MLDVVNNSRRDPVQANEAESTQNLSCRENPGKLLFIAQTILERNDECMRANQRREQLGEL